MIIIEKIRLFEAFAGIGSPRMALNNLSLPYESVGISEIDKYAIKSYEAIWGGKTNNLGDISKVNIDDIPDMDLFVYGSPCQDISQAGKMLGLKENSNTRSSLLWECKKIIENKKPKYLLMENVKNLVSKRFKADFDIWLNWLSEQGYTNYWEVLNAKDYGIPQNRERVFVISILGDHEPYKFPEKQELKLRLKDVLEEDVDKKFYLRQEQIDKIKFNTYNTEAKRIQEKEYCDTLCARDFKSPKCVKIDQIGQYDTPNRKNCNIFRVYNDKGLSPSLSTMQGGNLEPHVCEQRSDEGIRFFKNNICGSLRTNNSCGDKRVLIGASRGRYTNYGKTEQRLEVNATGNTNSITTVQKDNYVIEEGIKVKNATSKGYLVANEGDSINLEQPDSKTRRGRVGKEIAQTLTTSCNQAIPKKVEKEKEDIGTVDGYYVRKLTPKECWRLMGFPDWAFDKAEQVNSNSQLYKQAGNSIVVNVLEDIFKNLFKE